MHARILRPLCLAAAALVAGTALADDCCDAEIRKLALERHTGYRHRDKTKGDARCEGEYSKPVAARLPIDLIPLSFVMVSRRFDPSRDAVVLVAWPTCRESLRLRACHADPNTFYRMDHARRGPAPAEEGEIGVFHWDTDVLREMKFKSTEIHVLCEALPVANSPAWTRILIPVVVNAEEAKEKPPLACDDARMILTLRTNHEIRKVDARLLPDTEGATSGKVCVLQKDAPVASGGLVHAEVLLPIGGREFSVQFAYQVRTAAGWSRNADKTSVRVRSPSREFAAAYCVR